MGFTWDSNGIHKIPFLHRKIYFSHKEQYFGRSSVSSDQKKFAGEWQRSRFFIIGV